MGQQLTYLAKRPLGYAGDLADNGAHDLQGMRNDEASAEVAFGHAVKRGSEDDGVENLTAITGEIVAGIVTRKHDYADTQISDTGVLAGEGVTVARKGRFFVECEDGCSPGDRLHIRAVTSGSEVAGALRASADGTDTIDASHQGEWLSSAGAGEIAILEVNFLNYVAGA